MNLNVLIVDDSPTIRFIFKNNLEKITTSKIKVFEAGNGEAALGIMHSVDISLLITDIQMPVMNGVELITEVRKLDNYLRLPIIVVSAALDEHISAELKSLRISNIVSKPFTKSEFDSIVVSTIDNIQPSTYDTKIELAEFTNLTAKHSIDFSYFNNTIRLEVGEIAISADIHEFLSIAKVEPLIYDITAGHVAALSSI